MDTVKNKLFQGNMAVYLLIAFLVGGAVGIINPLATTHMTRENVGDIWIGAVSSAYFIFLSVGAVFMSKKMKGKDAGSIITIGLLIAALCSVLFPIVHNAFLWFFLMALMGIGISFNMVGIQSALHKTSNDGNRSVVSGMYSLFFAAGFIISSIVGPQIYEYRAWPAFFTGSVYLSAAAVLIRFYLKDSITIPIYSEAKIFKRVFAALCGAFAYGFSETTLVALYPLFLLKQNYSLDQMGYALGIFVIGCIVGIIPISRLSDKIGRKKVLFVIILVSFFAIGGIVVYRSFIPRMIFSFIAGITLGPVYPLSLALSVQALSNNELPSGTALFTFAYGIGSAAGPMFSALLMHTLGNDHIFTLSFVLFTVFLILMTISRKRLSLEESIE